MTEIKIEKKKPIWPWVLLILIVLGIIAYFVYANGDKDDYSDDFDDDVTNGQVIDNENRPTRSVYDTYEAFEESMRDSTRIAVDSSYTKKTFANLAKAVVKRADENDLEDSSALNDLREFSVLMTGTSNTSTDMENFKNFKTACDKVATVLEAIQVKNFPSLRQEVSSLKQSASKISPSTPMNKQQTDMNVFLQKSKSVLKSMKP